MFQSIPPIADEIILRAMNKSPINNFNTAGEFRDALIGLKSASADNSTDTSTKASNYFEVQSDHPQKQSKGFQRISNILLLIIFVGLGVIVFNVVKSIILDDKEDGESQLLNYTQDYSKNPNYLNSSDWQLLKKETDGNLNAIAFMDDYKGHIVGDSGLVLQTSNGGVNWYKIDSKYKNNFYSVSIADNRLFLVGSSGFIGYLNKSSKEIKKIISNTSETLFKIYFINNFTGLIVGSGGLILKTDDGGLTWRRVQSNINKNLFSIGFADYKNGIIVGWDGTILKTFNGGLTWEKQQVKFKSYFKDVLFVNEFLGFIVGGEGRVLRTENGGDDWDEVIDRF